MENTSPRYMPVLGTIHPIKIYFFVTSFLCSLEFLYFYPENIDLPGVFIKSV